MSNYQDIMTVVRLSRQAWDLQRRLDAIQVQALELMNKLGPEDMGSIYDRLGTNEVLPGLSGGK